MPPAKKTDDAYPFLFCSCTVTFVNLFLICKYPLGRKRFLWMGLHKTYSMCESSNPVNYSRRKISFADDRIDEDEKKIEEAFTKLSAHTIAKLIEDEPDVYSIEDVKVRYK